MSAVRDDERQPAVHGAREGEAARHDHEEQAENAAVPVTGAAFAAEGSAGEKCDEASRSGAVHLHASGGCGEAEEAPVLQGRVKSRL